MKTRTTEITARCGYRCDLCPAFAGNITSKEEAQKVCDGFAEVYGFTLTPEGVVCGGCRGGGTCVDADCPVRPCSVEKGLEGCAECDSFDSCPKLKSRMDFLEPLPEKMAALPPERFERFVAPFVARPRMLALRAAFLARVHK